MIICEHNFYKEAAEFYASKLGIPDCTIIAVGVFPQLDMAGYCIYHDDDVLPYIIIGIEESTDEGAEDPLAVLAHEMVHAKQYALGELVDHGTRKCSWHGKEYDDFEANSEEYFFAPWEVEAYGMQVGLYRMYCRSLEE